MQGGVYCNFRLACPFHDIQSQLGSVHITAHCSYPDHNATQHVRSRYEHLRESEATVGRTEGISKETNTNTLGGQNGLGAVAGDFKSKNQVTHSLPVFQSSNLFSRYPYLNALWCSIYFWGLLMVLLTPLICHLT